MENTILKIRVFVNKERVYILMLSFILLFNALIIFAEKVPEFHETMLMKKLLWMRQGVGEVDDKATASAYTKMSKEISWREVLEANRHMFIILNVFGFTAIFIFGLGLFLDIRILTAKLKKKQIFQVNDSHLAVNWKIWDIFKIATIFVFLGYIIYIFEGIFLSSFPKRKDVLHFLPLVNSGVMDLAILGFIIYFIKKKYGQSVEAIGLKIKGVTKTIFFGIVSYISFLPVLIFLLILLIWLASLFNYEPPQQSVFEIFLQEKSIWLLIYSTAMVVILGPIVEEIFFRAFSYNAIKKKWGAQTAAVLTAVVFAGLHANLLGFLPIMALGLLLVYVYEKTGSLIPAITIHIVHNGLLVSLLFLSRYLMRSLGKF